MVIPLLVSFESCAELFGGFHHCFESIGVVEGQVSKGFAVEIDVVGCQFVHEAAVSGAVGTGSGVDTGNPKAAVCTLFEFAAYVSVSHCAINGILGYGPDVFTTTEITFGLFENFFASGSRRYVVD